MNKKSINKQRSGFTLAEVLVTLLVIGVVASLTIPAIAYSIQKSMWVEAMKKTYSSLSQATNSIMQDNAGSLVGVFLNHNDMMNAYASKVGFVKACLAGQNPGECFHVGNETWHTLQGGIGWSDLSSYSRAVGTDGVLYRFNLMNKDCTNSRFLINGENSTCGLISFDINGFRGPNTLGRDMFYIVITTKGLYMEGSAGDSYYEPNWTNYCNITSANDRNGITCGHRIMQQGGMNY